MTSAFDQYRNQHENDLDIAREVASLMQAGALDAVQGYGERVVFLQESWRGDCEVPEFPGETQALLVCVSNPDASLEAELRVHPKGRADVVREIKYEYDAQGPVGNMLLGDELPAGVTVRENLVMQTGLAADIGEIGSLERKLLYGVREAILRTLE